MRTYISFPILCVIGLFFYFPKYYIKFIFQDKGNYKIKHLKRQNAYANAIISGHFYDSDSKKNLANLAIIVINNQSIKANDSGYYKVDVKDKEVNIIARNIFYDNLYVKDITVNRGDSLVIDFFLTGQATSN